MEYFHIESKVELAVLITAVAIIAIAALTPSIEHIFTNASAQTDVPTNNNTLFVTGSATNQIKPDKVTLLLGVETTNTTAQAALTANSDLMNKVLNALKAAGVQENETSTSTFSITPNYNYSANTNQGRLIGFTVSNSIQIESSNIDSVSKWIDAAVSAGANNVNNIDFNVSNNRLDDLENSLLKDAIGNAKTTADVAASAVGLKVISVRSIAVGETSSSPPVPVFRAQQAFTGGAMASPTPILSGQHEVSATVKIIYLIG